MHGIFVFRIFILQLKNSTKKIQYKYFFIYHKNGLTHQKTVVVQNFHQIDSLFFSYFSFFINLFANPESEKVLVIIFLRFFLHLGLNFTRVTPSKPAKNKETYFLNKIFGFYF